VGSKRQYVWVPESRRLVFDESAKTKILQQTQETIDNSEKLKQKVSRVVMRGNRVYLYELVEQFKPEGAIFIRPLIDGKYLEYPYARITMNDLEGRKCTADWQRHNNQWITLYEGPLAECFMDIEHDTAWFM
jgi:hypothetical protein